MKMWAGRFKKDLDTRVNDFNSSLHFDSRMYKEDICGSIAHATMLGKCGIIEQSESEKIIEGLNSILKDIEDGTVNFESDAEDIHMFIEALLTERIGDTGKRLHTARSRNDQVALDIKLYTKKEILNIIDLLKELLDVICRKATENINTVMPGYTHLQRAQPVTFAHYILAYAQMFIRDIKRLCDCYKRGDVMPLGSCALAGTTYPLDRDMTAKLLGFSSVTLNSIDGVSDRDFIIETASCLSMVMMHMSRFAEEIILWCSSEFSFIELDDAFSTGSSIMPQKKNPDVAELVRGKTGRVYGNLVTLLTMMKSLPLAYNKDMQEDKEAFFDSVDNTKISIEVFTKMFDTATVKKDNMRNAASRGFINATDCADYLVKKGLPFRTAYKIVGELVAFCIESGKTLETMTLEEYKSICESFDTDVFEAIDLDTCVYTRNVVGGPCEASVKEQIAFAQKFISEVECK